MEIMILLVVMQLATVVAVAVAEYGVQELSHLTQVEMDLKVL